MQPGKLYIVPTPIGNLKDITLRGIDTLKNSDFILAEDTRHTGKLLREFHVENKMISYHQHNEHKQLHILINKLKNGAQICLVSDAGTPGISDPGAILVSQHHVERFWLAVSGLKINTRWETKVADV